MTVKRKRRKHSKSKWRTAFDMRNLPHKIPVMSRRARQKCTASYSHRMCDENWSGSEKIENICFILVSNYRLLLEFTVVFFFVSANITVGQRCLTIKELERSRQNQAITRALSASSNTNMVADSISVSLKAELMQSFFYSSSDWTVGGANFVVTNYRQRTQIKVNW